MEYLGMIVFPKCLWIYGDRPPFWESLLQKKFFQNEALILGGDLNFSLGATKVWGPRERYDPLSDFFRNILEDKGLIDIEPIKLTPTWKNNIIGEDIISKIINHFLIYDNLSERYFNSDSG
jgi:hypothetical protein